MFKKLYVFLGATVADAAARPLHWVYNEKKLKSFISDVDFEMKKVSWPTWEELRGSTYVVLTLTFILGLYLFFADLILSKILSVLL